MKLSFRKELLLCFVVVTIIPLMITSVCLMNLFQKRVDHAVEENATQQLYGIEETMTTVFSDMETLLEELSKRSAIAVGIATNDSWERNQAYTTLYEKTADYREKAIFEIYDAEGTCRYSTGATGTIGNLPTYWGILKEAKTHPDEMVVGRASRYVKSGAKLHLARGIWDEEDNLIGYLLVGFNDAQFEELLGKTYNASGGITILDHTWNEVYSSPYAQKEELAKKLRSRYFAGESLSRKEDSFLTYMEPLEAYGLYVAIGERDIFTAGFSRILIQVLIGVAVAAFVVCLAVSGVMSNFLTKPIHELTTVMQKVRQGQMDARVNSMREDEFGLLSDTFDEMTADLKEYMEIQVRQQKELNDVTIAAMQAQLNPHFLYNTLDTMKWVAKSKDVPQLANMASDLANILRTSISGAQFIRLAEELQLVKSYMKIQQIRFENSFAYDVEVPMELEYYKIPKLIIQSVVENALIHGLKGRDHGQIFVNIYDEEEILYIEVSDDGNGMSREEMERINRGECAREQEVGRRRHIGLDSIAKILRLHYGADAGVRVEAVVSGGTKVVLYFPLKREG
ncbi:MAG: sensor histidine kinase [Lachnospiraceae bacterium]|nr:sensor histidine kinase [Lachnospiraceae bacterium]